jgi:hypothetical protein
MFQPTSPAPGAPPRPLFETWRAGAPEAVERRAGERSEAGSAAAESAAAESVAAKEPPAASRVNFVKRSLAAGRFLNATEEELAGQAAGSSGEASLARIMGERLVDDNGVFPEVLFWPALASSTRLQVLPAERYSECVLAIRQRLMGHEGSEAEGSGQGGEAKGRQTYLPPSAGTMRRFTKAKVPARESVVPAKRQHLQLTLDGRVVL